MNKLLARFPLMPALGWFAGWVLAFALGFGIGWTIEPVLFHTAAPPMQTAPSPVPPTVAPPPTATPSPAPSPLPTATATPPPTPTPTPPPTPTLWPEGQAEIIGQSVEGRPIKVYRFGNGPDQRMVIAGIHGGYEDNTVALAEKLITRLQYNPSVIPENVTLFILPVFNVDGYYDYPGQTYGRANAHGVDLNRNFDVLWKPDWNRTGCWDALPISAGPEPFSEPETQALRDFIMRPNIHLTALVSYHSAAGAIFAGGQPPTPASVSLAQTLARASGYTYPPQNYTCELTGQLIDWAAAHDIPAVDVELTTHHTLDLEINWQLLQAFLRWNPEE